MAGTPRLANMISLAVMAVLATSLVGPPGSTARVSASGSRDTVAAGVRLSAAGDRIQRSGSRSRDVTGDGWPDLVAREPGAGNGTLWVYPHSRKFQEDKTFGARVKVGTGWNANNWVGVAEVTGDTPSSETAPEAPADLLGRRASDGALLVYPHSGKFNGVNTRKAPIVVGYGFNGMQSMVLADVTADGYDDILAYDSNDKLWVYPHSGTFDGTRTFESRVLVRQGRLGWLLSTEWFRENPDLISAYTSTGEALVSSHTQKFNGTSTFSRSSRTVATGIFKYENTTALSLADLNGDGEDDVLKRMPNGYLLAYPFLGTGKTMLGDPALIGKGWNIMDLIT